MQGSSLEDLVNGKQPAGSGSITQHQGQRLSAKNNTRKSAENLPIKKRMKVALVETDPFSGP